MPKKKLPTAKSTPVKRVAGRSKRAPSAAAVPTVAEFMTRSPHTIGRDQTLVQARELMNKYRIRHLPVLDGGQLVGIVSQRDLYFVESLDASSSSETVTAEEAMSQDVFETPGDTPLSQVTQTLVRRKLGSAVVTRDGRVVGVFSTIDAMKALLRFLPGQT